MQNPAIALTALVLIALALYHETVASLVRLWTAPDNPTYHHGLLVVGVCAFLFYRRWVEVKGSIQLRPSLSASVLVLLTSIAWLLADLVSVQIVQQLTLVLLIALLVVSVVGYRSAWLFALPVGLLVFAIPVWEPLVPYLQWLTTHAVTFLLNLTGIPAVLEGIRIWVPAGTFEVTPDCSGSSQLIVGTMAGVLFAYANRLGRKAAFWSVTATVGISLLVNTLRVYTVVVAGQLTDMQHYFITTDHYTLGWILFGIGMFVFLLVASRLIGPGDQAKGTVSGQASGTVVVGNHAGTAWSALLALGALVLGPALVYAYQPDRGDIGGLALNLPAEIRGWRAATVPSDGYRPVFQNPDLEHERFYRFAEKGQVYLYIAAYAFQKQGKEAVFYANRVYDDKAWQPVVTRTQRLGNGATVQETRIQSSTGAEKLVWQWYYVHGFMVSSDYMAKLLNAWGTLNRDPAIAAVVVAADLEGGDEDTVALLTRFVADTRQTVEGAIDSGQRR